MPFQPLTTCSFPGCRALVQVGRCSAHRAVAFRHSNGATRHERGYGADWQRLRAQVLSEEEHCRRCPSKADPHVDHIVPKSEGGTDDRSNLQRLCGRCHRTKTGRDVQASRRRRAGVVSGPRFKGTPGGPRNARGHNEFLRGGGHNGRDPRSAA